MHLHDEYMMSVLTGVHGVSINEIITYNQSLGKEVYVMDVYRTPLEHAMSLYFEKIAYHFNDTEENVNLFETSRVIRRFDRLFPFLKRKDYFREIYNVEGEMIPSFFPHGEKILHIISHGIHYVKLRLMDSDSWDSLLTKLFGEPIYMVKDYESEQKKTIQLYRRFKQSYQIPKNVWERIMEDKEYQYYMNETERKRYEEKWREKRVHEQRPFFDDTEWRVYQEITYENKSPLTEEIDGNHYLDMGCGCRICDQKRRRALFHLQMGQKVEERVVHDEELKLWAPKPTRRKHPWFVLS
jgi:hypothetical protein